MLIINCIKSTMSKFIGCQSHRIKIKIHVYCTVPENIHTPPTEEFPGGGGFSKIKSFKEMHQV